MEVLGEDVEPNKGWPSIMCYDVDVGGIEQLYVNVWFWFVLQSQNDIFVVTSSAHFLMMASFTLLSLFSFV